MAVELKKIFFDVSRRSPVEHFSASWPANSNNERTLQGGEKHGRIFMKLEELSSDRT